MSSARSASNRDDTRARLIAAAVHEFARGGIDNTSVRALNRAANARHQSAVYYHFGDRWGLVEAALDDALGPMVARIDGALDGLTDDADVRTVLRCFVDAALVTAAGPDGRDRLLFIARLLDETGDRGQALIASHVRPVSRRAEQRIAEQLPNLAPRRIAARMLYALNALVHTLADRGMQRHWDLADVPRAELVTDLLDFLEGGLRFASTDQTENADDERPRPN